MFVHKDFHGQGIASALLSEIENKAREQNNEFIYSDISVTAKGFFKKKGFIVERQQLKKPKKKELVNFRMIKMNNNTRKYMVHCLGFCFAGLLSVGSEVFEGL